jgi:hypothetical protein
MTALLLMASMAQVGGSPLSSETFISTSFPREFAAVQRIQPGVLPDGHRIHRRYRILEYEMVERGGVREVTYTVRNTIQSEQNDVFRIKVTFLSDNGMPPERTLPTKGLPAYVQDGQGAKQWIHVETQGDARYDSRFKLATPHYAPTTATEMIEAEGVGKARVSLTTDNKYMVTLTTYLFHKGNRRDYFMIAGTLKP